MLTFAIAAGPTIPAQMWEALSDPSPPDLPFRATSHVLWANEDRTVAFAGWQDDVDLGMGDRCHVTPTGLTAFSGYLWTRSSSWTAGVTWSEQLEHHLRQHPLSVGTDELLGVFTAVSLDANGRGTVVSDPLGTSVVYRAEAGPVSVLSTRARLAARLAAGGPAPRDLLGAGWLAYCEFPVGPRTGYDGVEVIPAGSHADVSPAGVKCRPTPPPWRRLLAGDPHELLDGVYTDIATSIHAALAYPVERRVVELTGGMDSRLVLAVLLAEGLADQFEYRTLGDPDLPDVVIASHLADRYGLRHAIGPDPAQREHSEERAQRLAATYPDLTVRERILRLNVGAWSGMRNAWEVQAADPPDGDRVALNGMYGESLSTNYSSATRLRTHSELREDLLVNMKHGAAGILRPEALAHYRSELLAAAYDDFGLDDAPQDVMDGFFLRHRLRRWFGTTQESDEHNRVFPLYSPTGIRLGFSLGVRDRHWQWIYRKLYERACPELAAEPFAKGGWPETRAPDRRPEPSAARGLLVARAKRRVRRTMGARKATASRAAALDWARSFQRVDAEIMRRHLLDDPSNPVFDILDRRAVAAAIDGADDAFDKPRRQLHGALTAAIWMAGNEIVLPPVGSRDP